MDHKILVSFLGIFPDNIFVGGKFNLGILAIKLMCAGLLVNVPSCPTDFFFYQGCPIKLLEAMTPMPPR